MGPSIVAAVGEPSQEEEGELGLQFLVVGGPAVFFVDILGLAANEWESLVPAYTSSSIFCEKLRIGDVGERDNVSNENGSGVSGGCGMLSWLPWLFSRKLSLVAETWSCCLHVTVCM